MGKSKPASWERGSGARGGLEVGLTGTNRTARLAAGMGLVMAAGLVSGCIGSPTYGTDKTANAQLVSDLGGIFSFSPKKRQRIDYQPRPDLVKPAKGQEALPAPQESIAANNPQWPESPEQRLARVRADADANVDNPFYKSPVVKDSAPEAEDRVATTTGTSRSDESGHRSPAQASAENEAFKERLKASQQGDAQRRAYLSEPPTDYRQASADAAQGETGEDEDDKERRLKRAARKKSGSGFSLSDLNPF